MGYITELEFEGILDPSKIEKKHIVDFIETRIRRSNSWLKILEKQREKESDPRKLAWYCTQENYYENKLFAFSQIMDFINGRMQ